MVRYYGYSSNKSRVQRKKSGEDAAVTNIIDTGFRLRRGRFVRHDGGDFGGPVKYPDMLDNAIILRMIVKVL